MTTERYPDAAHTFTVEKMRPLKGKFSAEYVAVVPSKNYPGELAVIARLRTHHSNGTSCEAELFISTLGRCYGRAKGGGYHLASAAFSVIMDKQGAAFADLSSDSDGRGEQPMIECYLKAVEMLTGYKANIVTVEGTN